MYNERKNDAVSLVTLNVIFFENSIFLLQKQSDYCYLEIFKSYILYCIYCDRSNDSYINQICIVMHTFHVT